LAEDIRIEGTIPYIIDTARELVAAKLGTVIRQVSGGRFERIPLLPEFAWFEAIVNAVTHRSYSLQGDGIRVMLFEDRLEVESPGRLPGLVRVQNIQNARYSRNPHIARVLADMTGYVRELNEGVKRMFDEMREHSLQEPVYRSSGTNVTVILYTQPVNTERLDSAAKRMDAALAPLSEIMQPGGRLNRFRLSNMSLLIDLFFTRKTLSTKEAATALELSLPSARRYLSELESKGLVFRDSESKYDKRAMWRISDDAYWTSLDKQTNDPETS
jgi:ATP-dependent DNA helicase RecG